MAKTIIAEKKVGKSVLHGILLRRRLKLSLTPGKESNPNHVKAIAINIAAMGFVLSKELIAVMETLPVNTLTALNNALSTELSHLVGAHVKYRPLFRNFPKDVPDTFEYYIDRVVGHLESWFDITDNAKLLSCGHLINTEKWDMSNLGACPICQFQLNDAELEPAKERKPLNAKKERLKVRTITLGGQDEVFEIFKSLLSSNTSISPQDKEDIAIIFESGKEKVPYFFPESIPHKEVLSFVAGQVLQHLDSFEIMEGRVKNVTDVLRIAVALSNGDVSLATATKFRKFSKKERRFLLSMLEGCPNMDEDMVRYASYWKRLGEILHPGEYKARFPKAFASFTKIRNNEKIATFNSRAEEFMLKGEIDALLKHLKSRPSELGRKIDYIVSNSYKKDFPNVMETFTPIAQRIPTPTLLQIMANFRIRASKEKNIRIILPKGNLAKVQILDETRKPLSNDICVQMQNIIQIELKSRFAQLPSMGKVYLDSNLSSYVLPASQRSASKALFTIPRGSQVSLSNDDIVRMFIYWKELSGRRTDVDLSAILYDNDFNQKGHVSFTNYHEDGMVHSGDIQSAPHGASEFIDINKKKVIASGVRYVAMNVYSYTGQPFVEMPEAFAGIMGRRQKNSGEIYEPKTVKTKFDLTADSEIAIPLIIDLYENKMIWTDLSLKARSGYRTLETNGKNVQRIAMALSQMAKYKANIFELLYMHVESRGTFVDDPTEADLIFSEESIPGQLDVVMSEYLT